MVLNEWVMFIVMFLGTMFLIGELLVNMKGLFAIMGTGFMVVYFSAYLDVEMVVVMMVLYLIGVTLIFIDGKLVNDGTLALVGLAIMISSVIWTAPDLTTGLYSVIGVLLGSASSFLFLKVFKKREMWSKITLKDQLNSEMGYNSINMSYKDLVGYKGIAITDMRPVGTIEIDDREYSAVSKGKWIAKGDQIEVEAVDGTKILVNKI